MVVNEPKSLLGDLNVGKRPVTEECKENTFSRFEWFWKEELNTSSNGASLLERSFGEIGTKKVGFLEKQVGNIRRVEWLNGSMEYAEGRKLISEGKKFRLIVLIPVFIHVS